MENYVVIFDMDGVLIDSGAHHLKAWQKFGEKYGCPVREEAFYRTFGMRNEELMSDLFPGQFRTEEFSKLAEEKEGMYRDLAKGHVQALSGVKDFLDKLKESGILCVVGSSGPRKNVEFNLEEMGIRSYFADLVCGEDVIKGKPEPEVFLKAASKVGGEVKKCVVIEDAVMGVKAAKAAMMKCIAVTTTTTREALCEADLIVDDLGEISVERIKSLVIGL